MKELVAKLEELQKSSSDLFIELNSKFDDDNYDEEYEDTFERKYQEGFSDALSIALKLLNSLCITCNKSTDIVLHGHCGPCYYGYKDKE